MYQMKKTGVLLAVFMAMASLLVVVEARQGDSLSDQRGARSCYDAMIKRNVPADYISFQKFKVCVARSSTHAQNEGRDLWTALRFWTPAMIAHARSIAGSGSPHYGTTPSDSPSDTPTTPVKVPPALPLPAPDTSVDAA